MKIFGSAAAADQTGTWGMPEIYENGRVTSATLALIDDGNSLKGFLKTRSLTVLRGVVLVKIAK